MLTERLNHLALQQLVTEGLIQSTEADKATVESEAQPMSLALEIRLLFVIGFTALSSGIGIWIYQNIHSLGHLALLSLLTLSVCGGFAFCWSRRQPFSWQAQKLGMLEDSVLLGASLLLLALWAYLQWRYQIIDDHFSLLPLFPSLVFLPLAYRFDHRGLLTLAITGMAAWLGLSVNPWDMMKVGRWLPTTLMGTAFLFGLLLVLISFVTENIDKKSHFSFTYHLFGFQLMALASLTGMFHSGTKNLWFALVLVTAASAYLRYRLRDSYSFFAMAVILGYIGVSSKILKLIFFSHSFMIVSVYVAFAYLIVSSIYLMRILSRVKKSHGKGLRV